MKKLTPKLQLDKNKIKKAIRISGGVNVFIDNKAKYPNGTPVELVALWLEYGTSKMPSRPFIRTAIKKNKNKWSKTLRKTRDFNTVGKEIVNDIKLSIIDGEYKPLSQSTVNRKGHSNTLIDTGLLYDSIIYKKIKGRK